MSKEYYEKQLYVVNLKIDKTEKENHWSLKSKLLGGLFGIGFSLLAPIYTPSHRFKTHNTNIMEKLNLDYCSTVVFCLVAYFIFYVLVYFGLKNQNRIKLNKLHIEKERLQKELDFQS